MTTEQANWIAKGWAKFSTETSPVISRMGKPIKRSYRRLHNMTPEEKAAYKNAQQKSYRVRKPLQRIPTSI